MIYDEVVEPLLKLMLPKLHLIDGYIFIDTKHLGLDFIRCEVEKAKSVQEAQRWLNICLFETYFDAIFGDEWDFSDDKIVHLLDRIKESWEFQLKLTYPQVSYELAIYTDAEYGDLGLRLLQ